MKNDSKLKALICDLLRLKRVLIAYSGGVDSTFLVAVAREALGKDNVLAVTAVSETYPRSERKQALSIARRLDIRHRIINTNELRNELFRNNPVNRCFYCKDELFRTLADMARREGMTLCDASNYSDRSDFRPGKKAAAMWKVVSPLDEARLTKLDVRKLSRKMKLPTWNLPAQACLASRFPYGTPLSKKELSRIEKGEIFLKKFIPGDLRLRNHGEIARLEIGAGAMEKVLANRTKIAAFLKRLGWRYVTLDIEGYRMGSMNRLHRS